MRRIQPARFAEAPVTHTPKGYLCVLRDVLYGDRYCIVRIKRPDEISAHLDKEFPVEIALVFLADNAKEDARKLLELAAAPGEGVWFDMDQSGWQRLRKIGAPIRRRESPPSAAPSLGRLLNQSPPTAPRQRSTAHRRTDAARAAPARPASSSAASPRRRSTSHRTTNRATSVSSRRGEPTESTRQPDAPAASPPRRRRSFRRRRVFGFLFLATMLLGILYYVETGRNPILEVAHAAEKRINEAITPTLRLTSRNETSLTFAWNAAPGATGYEYRYRIIEQSRTNWRATTELSKEVRSLRPGSRVVFELRARLGSISSAVVRVSTRTLPAQATQAPATVVPAATDLPPTVTDTPPTATDAPTDVPPTATLTDTPTDVPPTATATDGPTDVPPTATLTDTPTDIPATATATDTPTDIPATATAAEVYYAGDRAYFRACPRTSCPVLARLEAGAPIVALRDVFGETIAGSNRWILFQHEGVERVLHSSELARAAPADLAATTQPSETAPPTVTPAPSLTPLPTETIPPTATDMPTDIPPTATTTDAPTDIPPTATAVGEALIVETVGDVRARVRACPGTSCAILGYVYPGDELRGLERVAGERVIGSDAWVRFLLEGRDAFIHSSLVRAKA